MRYIRREPAKVTLKPTRVEPHAFTEPRHSLLKESSKLHYTHYALISGTA